ncbi:MAG: butyrate kinase [Lachnospiraceae bacterium]|nr:butyrate kinase [Lachnospiraceae bacterium]
MADKVYKILCINTGSTSTKIAIYNNEELEYDVTLNHDPELCRKFPDALDQIDMRKEAIYDFLKENNIKPEDLDAIAARGGPTTGIRYHSGAYKVDADMVAASKSVRGSHPMNIGPVLAYEFVEKYGIPAWNYDVVGVDEAPPVAHMTAIPGADRPCSCHTLNSRAAARRAAEQIGKKFEESTIVVGHFGGGCSSSLFVNGRLMDTSSQDGGFSPTRAGRVGSNIIMDKIFKEGYGPAEMKKLLGSGSGFSGHLHTADLREVEQMIADGDEYAALVYDAFIYEHIKDFGGLAAVVGGKVDACVLTGGIAYSKKFVDAMTEKISFIAPVVVIPGSMEMEALAKGIYRVLTGQEQYRLFKDPF